MNVSNIGVVLRQTSQPKDALESFRRSRGIFRKLTDTNPAVTFYQSALAQVTGLMAGIQADDDDWEPALGYYGEALAAYRKLADTDPSVISYQIGVARTNNNLASTNIDHQRYAEALPYVDASLGVYQKLLRDRPDSVDAINGLGFSYLYRGEVQHHSGLPAEAARDLRQAVQLWGKLKTQYLETRFERGRALAILAGLGGNPKSGVTAAEAADFADQAVAAVQDAIRAGLRQTEGLAKADFDALRGRADFQKLLASLPPKSPGR
jgi:tetratricopeptide (TPR) repeat protein